MEVLARRRFLDEDPAARYRLLAQEPQYA